MRRCHGLALVLAACARDTTPSPAAPAAAAASAEARAKDLAHCFVSGDFRPMAALTLPVVVEGMGGADAMAKRMSDGMQEGPKVLGVNVGAATVHPRGATTYAFVPFTLEVAGLLGFGKRTRDSWLLGVSRDGARTWHFVDGATLTRDKLRRVLPDFPDDLELPKKP